MHHRGRNRIRAKGQAPDRGKGKVTGQFAHNGADQRGCYCIEGYAPKVDVVVGFTPTGQSDLAADYRFIDDLLAELLPCC